MFEPKSGPKINNVITSRWVLRWKKDADGNTIVKARLVVKGFLDKELKSLIAASPTANRDS